MHIIARESLGIALAIAGERKINRCVLRNHLWVLYCE